MYLKTPIMSHGIAGGISNVKTTDKDRLVVIAVSEETPGEKAKLISSSS